LKRNIVKNTWSDYICQTIQYDICIYCIRVDNK
jgi:hypothetical protein